MTAIPFTTIFNTDTGFMQKAQNHLERKLSSMKGQYLNAEVYAEMLKKEDILLYEVYENIEMPKLPGELYHGSSIVHPGKVGEEYFMTKGHFHQVLETAEVYYCVHGHGFMMMETPEGEWAAEELKPGVILYVPPRWAHRSINVGKDDLITFFVYPGDAGHDYGTIEAKGFHKLLVEQNGKPVVIDNPRWAGK
jgi:glucose-6-phosphate isomerase, archaeal